jgi:hypothetical protein
VTVDFILKIELFPVLCLAQLSCLSRSYYLFQGDGESVPEMGMEESYSTSSNMTCISTTRRFHVNIELDVMALMLFLGGLATRMYRLEEPRSIV